jgi:hypothetical protein
LIGSPLLRAHMHGYYMDVRLYRKAVSGQFNSQLKKLIFFIHTKVSITCVKK